jgi:hypothetical protein
MGNLVSANNSSTTPLGISGVFTGTGEDISKYAAINITVFTDQDSAINGLSLQWSSDNTNWDHTELYTITGNVPFVLQAMGEANYFRIVYTNGTTGQVTFRLHTILKTIPSIGEVQHLDESVADDSDAQLVRAILAGKQPGGDYTNVQTTTAGNLKVAIEEADTSATGLAKAEDAIHASGDTGVMSLGVRKDVPTAIAADGDYVPFLMSEQGALWTHDAPSEIDSGNSTTTPLGISGVFTGTGADLLESASVSVILHASHDSATDGMQFQFSSDNTNWDITQNFTYIAANGGRQFQFGIQAQYFRVVFTNGTTAQTHLRIQALLQHTDIITTIHRIGDDVSPDRSATIHKSCILAQQGGGGPGAGDYIPVQATASGNFKISVEEFDTSLPAGANNIGDVDIASHIPGTGATNLGKAQDSAGGATDTGVAMLAIRDDEQAAMTPADGDYSTLRTDKFGNLKVTQLPDATSEIKYGVIDAALSGDNTLQAAAGAGIKIRVLSVMMVSAGTVTARFESGASGTALTGQMNLVANSGFTLPYNPAGWFETADNTLLNLELSAAISVDGCFTYVEV